MSETTEKKKAFIPDELREILLEFIISYLLEQPSDPIAYAAIYFEKLRKNRPSSGGTKSVIESAPTSSSLSGERKSNTEAASVPQTSAAATAAQSLPIVTESLETCSAPSASILTTATTASAITTFTTTATHSSSVTSVNSSPEESYQSNDDEPPVTNMTTRRKSVFAETYNPEDDDDDGSKIIFPKSDEQRNNLAENIRNIFLFRTLDSDQMHDVLDAMFERKVVKGETVIQQGDDGDNFYVIQSGIYKAYVNDDSNSTNLKHIHTYENSGSFGELALLYNMPRAATIVADSDGSLWAMDRQTFRRIILKAAFKKRKMYETLIENVPMLSTLKAYERMNLADALIPRNFATHAEIIRQGDAADGMYFIEDGTVVISVRDNSGQRAEVSRLQNGAYFGELALVTKKPRAASAHAETDVKLAFLDVEAFERLLGPCMQLMKRNINDYEEQLVKIFGSKLNLQDLR